MKLHPFMITGLAVVGALVALVALWGGPQYSVYSQRLAGEAELARAEYTRRVAVLEAQARAG